MGREAQKHKHKHSFLAKKQKKQEKENKILPIRTVAHAGAKRHAKKTQRNGSASQAKSIKRQQIFSTQSIHNPITPGPAPPGIPGGIAW